MGGLVFIVVKEHAPVYCGFGGLFWHERFFSFGSCDDVVWNLCSKNCCLLKKYYLLNFFSSFGFGELLKLESMPETSTHDPILLIFSKGWLLSFFVPEKLYPAKKPTDFFFWGFSSEKISSSPIFCYKRNDWCFTFGIMTMQWIVWQWKFLSSVNQKCLRDLSQGMFNVEIMPTEQRDLLQFVNISVQNLFLQTFKSLFIGLFNYFHTCLIFDKLVISILFIPTPLVNLIIKIGKLFKRNKITCLSLKPIYEQSSSIIFFRSSFFEQFKILK